MLFGDSDTPTAQNAAETAEPGTPAATDTAMAPAPAVQQAAPGEVVAPVPTIVPVSIEQGSDTGTSISKKASLIRNGLVELENSLKDNAQKLTMLRNSGAGFSVAYYQSKAHITARLQVGTTRSNPELVSEWNRAQSNLDQLTGNINSLNALAKDAANDAANAHYTYDQITAALTLPGSVDEDRRQLRVLQDETSQTIVVLDRLLGEVADVVQRQTAYVANERANLTALAGAIKNGEFYGTDFGTQMVTSAAAGRTGMTASAGSPLLVIRFDTAQKDYQDVLYTTLRQALQRHPNAAFKLVAIAPAKRSVADRQLARTDANRRAQEVLQSMTDMGVPSSRLSVASATDPAASVSEVQLFIR